MKRHRKVLHRIPTLGLKHHHSSVSQQERCSNGSHDTAVSPHESVRATASMTQRRQHVKVLQPRGASCDQRPATIWNIACIHHRWPRRQARTEKRSSVMHSFSEGAQKKKMHDGHYSALSPDVSPPWKAESEKKVLVQGYFSVPPWL